MLQNVFIFNILITNLFSLLEATKRNEYSEYKLGITQI